MQQEQSNIRLREQEDEIEIDLVELMYFYQSKLLWIIAAFIIGAVVMGLVTVFMITPKYTASSKVYMVSASSDSIVDLTDLNLGTSLSKDYEELLKSRPIFEAVIDKLNLDYEYEELLDMVTISTQDETRILIISVESPSREEAKDVANELAELAVSKLPQLMDTSKPNIVETAILAEEPSSPSLAKNVMIGALVLTLLVMGILTFGYVTDDTLNSAEDVESAFGIMPLTVIPESDIGELSEKKEKKKKANWLLRKLQTRESKKNRKTGRKGNR